MASRLFRKTLATTTRYLTSPAPVRPSPPAVQKTAVPLPHSVAAAASFRGPSATTAFRRMFSTHEPKEGRIMKFTELYNPSEKILIACVRDFVFALDFATQLGDARNIVVISPFSYAEVKRLCLNSCCHMTHIHALKKLGVTMVFNVNFEEFEKDTEGNRALYDRMILDKRPY